MIDRVVGISTAAPSIAATDAAPKITSPDSKTPLRPNLSPSVPGAATRARRPRKPCHVHLRRAVRTYSCRGIPGQRMLNTVRSRRDALADAASGARLARRYRGRRAAALH
jgi:hypothetical protein